MKEEWKPIKGYEGFYEVSNHGRIRSLDRVQFQKDSHGGMMTKRYHGKIMNPTDNGNGYLIIMLNNNKRKPHYIHRLVAETFIDNPNNFSVVNHLDFNKKNNRIDNLEWTTQKNNVLYSSENMCKPKRKYRKSGTGEKYIQHRNNKWQLNIWSKNTKFYKTYNSLEEAISAREVIIGG